MWMYFSIGITNEVDMCVNRWY